MPFKIANDTETDYRAFVRAAYDRCAMNYANQRRPTAGAELNLIAERLGPGSRILDVGCGAGIPVSRQLADKFEVTGVDISSSMIGMARKNVPSATFIHADVLETGFPPQPAWMQLSATTRYSISRGRSIVNSFGDSQAGFGRVGSFCLRSHRLG